MSAILILVITYYYQYRGGIAHYFKKRSAELTYSFSVSKIPSDAKGVIIWVPMPLSNGHQKLLDYKVLGEINHRIVDEWEYGNRFILFEIACGEVFDDGAIEISIVFDIVRYAISPIHENSSVEQFSDEQLARYLGPGRLIPIDGKIAQEAYQTAGYLDNKLKQVRLLYDHIVDTFTYDKSGTGWGRGDAVYACDMRRGNCTDFHSLFIGQARALKIPARFIMGLPLPADEGEGAIGGYHCWGEFYISEKGWLPIDASEASKFPEKRELYFGGLDEHRVAFTIGRDIKLPGSVSKPLNYVIYPHVEIDGKIHTNVQTKFYFKNY